MSSALRQAAGEIVALIESVGVEVSPTSRFAQMANAARLDQLPTEGHDSEMAREALRDIYFMCHAIIDLIDVVPQDVLAEKVKLATQDATLIDTANHRTPGRDIQFELYIASVCARAGLRPILDEPDIVCNNSRPQLGIAAKRLKSRGQFEKRFRKACDQIEGTGIPGLIAMDLSLVLNPQNKFLGLDHTPDSAAWWLRDLAEPFIRASYDSMLRWRHGREVRGIIVFHSVLRRCPEDDWELNCQTFGESFDGDNQQKIQEFLSFFKTYQIGIRNIYHPPVD